MTVNCHMVRLRGATGLWDECGDKFPVNTYKGNAEEVLKCLNDLFANKQSGINKVVILLDDEMPEAKIGQAPMQLGDSPESI